MEGDERRKRIVELLTQSDRPVSGSEIARKLGVSRQIIVQDIALLRAGNKNILSTYKGYVLFEPNSEDTKYRRAFLVFHEDDEIKDELYTIVDCGGKMLDVVIEHAIYGQITVDLILKNRVDVDEFVHKLATVQAVPLKKLTGGRHIHTVEADSEEILDKIEEKLSEKGYLLRCKTEYRI